MPVGAAAQAEHTDAAADETCRATSGPHPLMRQGVTSGAMADWLLHWHAKSVGAAQPAEEAAEAMQDVYAGRSESAWAIPKSFPSTRELTAQAGSAGCSLGQAARTEVAPVRAAKRMVESCMLGRVGGCVLYDWRPR